MIPLYPIECLKLIDQNTELLEFCASENNLKWCYTFGKKKFGNFWKHWTYTYHTGQIILFLNFTQNTQKYILICNRPKLKATQKVVNRWMNEQIMWYLYGGILFSHKMIQLLIPILTWINHRIIMLSERSQEKKIIAYTEWLHSYEIVFLKNATN